MKRVISQKQLKNAYKIEEVDENIIDEKIQSIEERGNKLPEEIFEIIGDMVSFIQDINSLEE